MPDGTTTEPGFRVSERARAQIREIAAREGRPAAGMRLAVEAGGCSGFQYGFGLEDAPAEDDVVVGDGPAGSSSIRSRWICWPAPSWTGPTS